MSLIRWAPLETRRIVAMSSSGLTDVWTRAAAPDLIAANSPSSSSIATSTMIPALGSSRLIRGMVSKPAGTGKAASTRTMSGAFSTTASSALGPSTVVPTTSRSGSASRRYSIARQGA
jgi:hypothetical protein